MNNPEPQQTDWLAVAKTKPLSVQEIACWFDVSTRHASGLVSNISGAEKIGRRWRIPVCEMTPGYLVEVGLIVPVEVKSDVRGHSCMTPDSFSTSNSDGHKL